jgi:hypothetical protein
MVTTSPCEAGRVPHASPTRKGRGPLRARKESSGAALMALPASFRVTIFPSDRNPQGERLQGDFLEYLKRPHPKTTPKKKLPMWSLTEFEGDYRSQASARRVHGITYDVDIQPTPSLETILAAVNGFGCVTTSPSSTPNALRWRLILALDEPVLAKDYKRLALYVASRLPFAVAPNSIEPARAWYAPREPEEGAYVLG